MKVQFLLYFLPLVGFTAAYPTDSTDLVARDAPTNATAPTAIPDEDDSPDVEDPADEEMADLGESIGGEGDLPLPPLEKRNIPTQWGWTQNYKFTRKPLIGKRRTMVTGNSLVNMKSDGNVRFYTYMRATRVLSYNYAITCGIRDKVGRWYTMTHKGTVCGSGRPWCSSKSIIDDKTYVSSVKAHWADIMAGDRKMVCKAQAKWALGDLLNDIKKMLEKTGKVVGAAIKIFG
ncbi:hypothetical protein GQ44DRAFT_230062 [Phaeosphaeriaceae sp. PMI808]|nr:hypothetical protein GQ44DRAFT_230062 [Phaeosphaeriaceae sp. PMI808]